MRAVVLRGYGGNDQVEVADEPAPRPRTDEMLVRVHAAGVNAHDWKVRQGALRALERVRLPAVLGTDLSGVVEEVGRSVTRFRPGDAVFAMKRPDGRGAFAELAPVREREAALKPASVTHEAAAATPLVGLAAWAAVVEAGRVGRSDRVLVNGGTGGVGHLAVQLAKRAGAVVAATASAGKLDLARSSGADLAIDYRSGDLAREFPSSDVVVDTVGGDSMRAALAALKVRGRLVSTVGSRPIEDLAREHGALLGVAYAGLGIAAAKARAWNDRRASFTLLQTKPDGARLARFGEALADGSVKALVGRVRPLAEAREALEDVERHRVTGRVVLRVA